MFPVRQGSHRTWDEDLYRIHHAFGMPTVYSTKVTLPLEGYMYVAGQSDRFDLSCLAGEVLFSDNIDTQYLHLPLADWFALRKHSMAQAWHKPQDVFYIDEYGCANLFPVSDRKEKDLLPCQSSVSM